MALPFHSTAMRVAAAISAAAALAVLAETAGAQQAAPLPQVLVAVPGEAYPALAAQIADGAGLALAGKADVRVIEAPCDDAPAATAAAEAAATAPAAIIGLPCIEALAAFAQAFAATGTPIVTVGGRAPLRIRPEGLRLIRTGERETALPDAVSRLLVPLWRGTPFAILDDGSVEARALAEALRNAAEAAGTPPVALEEFRPGSSSHGALLARLAAAGARAAFIAGDAEDVAQISREARAAVPGLDIAVPESALEGAQGARFPDGLRVIARRPPLPPALAASLAAARQTPFAGADGYVADAYIAGGATLALLAAPDTMAFETALGQFTAAEDGFLEPAPHALFTLRGGRLEPAAP